VRVPFGQFEVRRSVLDRAHLGDIEGAFGRVRVFDAGPRLSLARRLGTLLAIMGPGLVVMAADVDAGTLSVFAQTGQDYGLRLLWVLLLLAPVLFVNQEMVARLGAVTGAGHARLIFERFGRRWGAFALGDLLLLNVATIVTEFIGVALALGYFGVSRYVSVPLAALALVAITATGSFRRWERTMYVLVAVNLVAIPLALASHPHPATVARAAVPGLGGPVDSASVLFVLALVGTTVSPWQLFFQQSNVVDKRITARWLSYERTDTLVGALVFTLCAIAVVVACATAFAGTAFDGAFTDAGAVAHELGSRLGAPAGALFALLLLNASILGAGCVTLSTSYALGDVFGIKHSLHRRWQDARLFHGSFALSAAVAAAIVLVPGAPLGLVTTAVQALAGVLLPSASVFLLLLCNDRPVLGPWTNPRWLNALATLVVGVLLVLSALLTATTLVPEVGVAHVAVALALALAVVLVLFAVIGLRRSAGQSSRATPWERLNWSMPPLERLPRPSPSRARTLALAVLRTYLTVAGILLVVKIVELATQR
jgi:NRAMP (natural resistance-associated macrophage protein)-like metal ion transporter